MSLLLSPSLWFPNAPLKCRHGSGNSSLAPAHRGSRPKTTLVQTEWQTGDDTVSSASYAQRVCWFDAGGNGDDAAEFRWRGAFPVSTEALWAEECPLVNNTQRIFSASAHILKSEILKGWNYRSNLQGISIWRRQIVILRYFDDSYAQLHTSNGQTMRLPLSINKPNQRDHLL